MKTVKVGSFDLRGPPYYVFFDNKEEFMRLAKELQTIVFEANHEVGVLRKKKVKILFFIPNEFIICQYQEEV
ncbi:hypothetical protein DRO69_00400 [Candidatus Bathyarchaeota archaeon]|nr:MAG: hypothetical protein DRO69_00400 [Candidatus Bathyarchaeota archaeon]